MKVGKYKVHPRFFLFILIFLGVLVFIGFKVASHFNSPAVAWGKLDTDQEISALVLRDEIIVNSPESGRFKPIAAEGTLCSAGAEAARLYKSGYSDKYMQNLLSLQQNIKDWQENNILMDLIDTDLVTLNSKINATLEEIRTATAQGDNSALLPLESELSALMTQRQEYMRTAITPDDYLNKLYDQEAALIQKINDSQAVITTPSEGLISFIFDNCETLLNVEQLPNLTPKSVADIENQILKGKRPGASTGVINANAPLFRIVSTNSWYALVVMNKRACTLTPESTCNVTFDGLSEPIEANVIRYVEEGSKVLVVLQMEEGASEMVTLRKINGHLGASTEGFKVPVNALVPYEGGSCLYIQGSEGVVMVPVEILAQDSRSAIVAEVEGSGGVLVIGQKLVMP